MEVLSVAERRIVTVPRREALKNKKENVKEEALEMAAISERESNEFRDDSSADMPDVHSEHARGGSPAARIQGRSGVVPRGSIIVNPNE